MNAFIDWVMQDPKTRIPVVTALIGICGVIIGGFFTVIVWPRLNTALGNLWDKIAIRLSRRSFEYRYLDWLINQHQYLPVLPTTLVPVTDTHVHELDNIYVALAVTEDPQRTRAISLSDASRASSALVILGDPGAGKTTMLRYLALTFARARRRRVSHSANADRKQAKRNIQQARKRVKEEFGYTDCPLPIFVYLNRLKDVIEWPTERSLLDALRDEWKSIDNLRDFPVSFFNEKLRRGQCIFFFDAFDELGTQEARDLIAQHIGSLAASAPKGNRFIVTSRIVGYNGQLSQYGFRVLTVQRLSWELISQLVKKWYELLHKSELADQLLSQLRMKPGIAELAVNPMLLSLIVLVQYVRSLIPDHRHVLYEECIKILVERRYAPPRVQEEYNKVLPSDEAVRLLREIAYSLHKAHLREISRKELEEIIIPEALKQMSISRAAAIAPDVLLKNIEQRSQLLVERGFNDAGQPAMAFSHLTFQEYLTAVALKEATGQRGEALISKEIIREYEKDPDWWEEVGLLYAAQLDNSQQQTFFHRLYPQGV